MRMLQSCKCEKCPYLSYRRPHHRLFPLCLPSRRLIAYDSLSTLSIFSLIHPALALSPALGYSPYKASLVCRFVLPVRNHPVFPC
jgi:hypothetical protein